MKYIIVIMIIIMNLTLLNADEYRIVDSRNSKTLTLQQMAAKGLKNTILYFSNFTIMLLSISWKENLFLCWIQRGAILSLEMFEPRCQSDLDAYIRRLAYGG